MTRYRRRTYRPDIAAHLSGVRAWFDGDCVRCDDGILVGQQIVQRGDGWMHASHQSGADE